MFCVREFKPALPGERPSARGLRDAVGSAPGDKDVGAFGQRQHTVVLQQDLRFGDRLAGDGAVLGRAQQLVFAGIGPRRRLDEFVQQAGAQLDAKDTADRFVEDRHRDGSVPDLGDQRFVQALPVVGHHVDVEPGEQRLGAIGIGAAGNLAVAVPVADHEPVEAQLAAQDIGKQHLVAMHLDAVDRIEAGHDRFDARIDRRGVGRGVDRLQRFNVPGDLALVDPLVGPAIAKEMLGGGNDVSGAETVGFALAPLQTFDKRCAKGGDDGGIFGIAFIGPAPAVVAGDGDGGREIPVDSGHLDLDGGRFADPADEIGVARRAQADVVRKDGRPHDIGVAVHRIGAPHGRDDGFFACQRLYRGEIHFVGKAQPLRSGGEFIAIGAAVSAIEIAAEAIAAHVVRSEGPDLRLDQLRNLAFEAHPSDEIGNARIFVGDGRGWRRRYAGGRGGNRGASRQPDCCGRRQ